MGKKPTEEENDSGALDEKVAQTYPKASRPQLCSTLPLPESPSIS
jgi:hypothetical protein